MSFKSSENIFDFDDQDQYDDFENDEFAENPFKNDAEAELEDEFNCLPNDEFEDYDNDEFADYNNPPPITKDIHVKLILTRKMLKCIILLTDFLDEFPYAYEKDWEEEREQYDAEDEMLSWEASQRYVEKYRTLISFPFYHLADVSADEENNGYPTFEDFPFNHLENVFEGPEKETEARRTRHKFNRKRREDEDESEDEPEQIVEIHFPRRRRIRNMRPWENVLEDLKRDRIEIRGEYLEGRIAHLKYSL
jgi:hypothetical protein